MAHACSCRHGSSTSPAEVFTPVRPEETVGTVVQRHPGALEIMKRMGINHCCGAGLALREAAASVGVPLDGLLAALNEPGEGPA